LESDQLEYPEGDGRMT